MSRNRYRPAPEPFLIVAGFRECERCHATTDDARTILQLADCGIANDRPWLCIRCTQAHRLGCPACLARPVQQVVSA